MLDVMLFHTKTDKEMVLLYKFLQESLGT